MVFHKMVFIIFLMVCQINKQKSPIHLWSILEKLANYSDN